MCTTKDACVKSNTTRNKAKTNFTGLSDGRRPGKESSLIKDVVLQELNRFVFFMAALTELQKPVGDVLAGATRRPVEVDHNQRFW